MTALNWILFLSYLFAGSIFCFHKQKLYHQCVIPHRVSTILNGYTAYKRYHPSSDVHIEFSELFNKAPEIQSVNHSHWCCVAFYICYVVLFCSRSGLMTPQQRSAKATSKISKYIRSIIFTSVGNI